MARNAGMRIEKEHTTKQAAADLSLQICKQLQMSKWTSICSWQPMSSNMHFAATPPACSFKVHCHVSSKATRLHVNQMSMHMQSAHIKLLMCFEHPTATKAIVFSSTASSTKELTQQSPICCRRCIRLEYRTFFRMPVCSFVCPCDLKGCGGHV